MREPGPGVDVVAWSLKDIVWASLLVGVLFLGTPVLIGIAGRWLHVDLRSGAAGYFSGALLALLELLFLVPAWAFSVRKYRAGWRDLGLREYRPGLGCLAVVGMLCLTLWVNVVWGQVLLRLGWPGQPSFLPLFGQGAPGLLLAFVGLGLVAPFAEEVFFRGFAFPVLRQRFGLWLGIGINAAFFALLHFTPTVLPPLLVLGAAFCVLYQFTGSIWPGIVLHASVNSLALFAAYLLPRQ